MNLCTSYEYFLLRFMRNRELSEINWSKFKFKPVQNKLTWLCESEWIKNTALWNELSIKYWIYVSKVDGICTICNYTETFYENVNVVHWYNKPKNASVTILNMHSVNGSAIFARYWKFAPRMRKNFGNSHWSKSIQNKKGKVKSFCMQNVYL